MPVAKRTEKRVDVLYVLALDEDELQVARAVAEGPFLGHPGVAHWTPQDASDATPYERGEFLLADGSSFSVAITSQLRMAADSASRTLATLIERLHPRCLAMSGVCAGRPKVTAYGDVIVAETAYFAADGKKAEDGFRPDIRPHALPVRWLRRASTLRPDDLPSYGEPTGDDAVDWFLDSLLEGRDPRDLPERGAYFGNQPWKDTVDGLVALGLVTRGADHRVVLTTAGRSRAEAFRYDHPDAPLKLPFAIRVGPMTSKPYVDASDPWEVLTTSGVRTVIGLEMESASVAASAYALDVPNWIVAKGVMDHATPDKADRYKSFAARASAEVVWKFLVDRRITEPTSICYRSDEDFEARSQPSSSSSSDQIAGTLPATNFQRTTDTFVDREAPRRRCVEALRGGARLITVHGPSGAGKSRLAAEAAHEVRADVDDHVYVVDLSVVTDPELVLAKIMQVLQVEPGDPLLDALREVFRGTPALLILENFEQVPAAANRIQDLLNAAPELQIIVTSDTPVGLQGELLVEAEPLPAKYAEELFLARSQRPITTPEERARVADLCRSLREPLAIELAAAQVRTSTLGELQRVLQSPAFLDLENRVSGVPDRHRTLAAALAWSFGRLDSFEQAIFVRLSVFDGSWTEGAAAAVIADVAEGQPAIRWLPPLVERRFVDRDIPRNDDAEASESRYTMLFALRAFGRRRLHDDAALYGRARTAHAAHYLRLVEGYDAQLSGPDGLEAAEELSHDHSNIHAALKFLVESSDTLAALRMAVVLDRYWWSRGYTEGYAHISDVLKLRLPHHAGRDDRLRRGQACLAAGKLALRQFDLDRAASLFAEASRVGRAEELPALHALALERSALVDVERTKYEDARAVLNEALDIFGRVDGPGGIEGQADCLDDLGNVACELDDGRAEEHFQAALNLYSEVSGPQASAWVRNDQAQAAFLAGELLRARLHAEYVQAVGRTYEEPNLLIWSGNTLGHVAAAEGDLETAREFFGESLTRAALQANLRPRLRALEGLVVVASRAGKHAAAISLLTAVDQVRKLRKLPRANTERHLIQDAVDQTRAQLSEAETIRSENAGSLMKLEQAAKFARSI